MKSNGRKYYKVADNLSLVIVQLLSCVQLFASPWTAALQASLSFIISWSLLKHCIPMYLSLHPHKFIKFSSASPKMW